MAAVAIEDVLHAQAIAGNEAGVVAPRKLWRKWTLAVDRAIGAVVAYRRDEHMRMSALFRVVTPPVRETLEVVASAVIALFCIELSPTSRTFYDLETIDFSPH